MWLSTCAFLFVSSVPSIACNGASKSTNFTGLPFSDICIKPHVFDCRIGFQKFFLSPYFFFIFLFFFCAANATRASQTKPSSSKIDSRASCRVSTVNKWTCWRCWRVSMQRVFGNSHDGAVSSLNLFQHDSKYVTLFEYFPQQTS